MRLRKRAEVVLRSRESREAAHHSPRKTKSHVILHMGNPEGGKAETVIVQLPPGKSDAEKVPVVPFRFRDVQDERPHQRAMA